MIGEPLYYAERGKVWKRPVETRNQDGSKSISIGFPVCVMHEAAGAEAAETVAALMNAGDAAADLLAALKEALPAMTAETRPERINVPLERAISNAQRAIAKAEGRQS